MKKRFDIIWGLMGKNIYNYLAIILSFVLLLCIDCKSTSSVASYGELISRLQGYYDYEKRFDWNNTYRFRTPLFRKSVNLKMYKNKMLKDNAGWKIIGYNRVNVYIKGNYAAITIKFIEKVPEEYLPSILSDRIELEQLSTWEKIDGQWFVRDACSRTHLDLNSDLVMRNDQNPITIERVVAEKWDHVLNRGQP